MCGIAGCYGGGWDVERALKRIRHRGPDGSGLRVDGDVTHGHVRLSVLDLSSASDQPFRYEGGTLTYNGELWNFRELRAELTSHGRKFKTTGDTEVVAAALSQWGAEALSRFEGMFALAWSQGKTQLLARDRYGKIPLYVLREGKRFQWASERKAWSWPVGARPSPLPPGKVLDLSTGVVSDWYRLPKHVGRLDTGASLAAVVLSQLRAGVRARMVADAPLCALISGGLDSSLILALAKEVNPNVVAYTAVLDDKAEDLLAARRLCADLSVPLHEVEVPAPTEKAMVEAVTSIEIMSKAQTEIAMLCIPLADRIARDGFKVCLSGEASDELFGGYGNMQIAAAQKDADWRTIRVEQLQKMSRGNFVRCNKAFMARGVECRLPFMERQLVEAVLSMSADECPPGKKLLKEAARDVLPQWVVKRRKDTFQGGSGMSAAAEKVVANPRAFYASTARTVFGGSVDA